MSDYSDIVYDASGLDKIFGQADTITNVLFVFTIIFFILSFTFAILLLFSPKFKNKIMGMNSKSNKKKEKPENIKEAKNIKEIDETIYCKYCGEEIDSDSVYCKNCGRKIK